MGGPQRPAPPGYEIVRVLGAGGFGEVVLARHVRLKRLVAIKRIHEYALTDDDALARFQREAKVLAATDCPSIVRVYDLVRSSDTAQLVMEYVPGQALSDVLEAGPLAAADAIVVLGDVADALASAAAQGIVHRDIKPANVFVLPDGHAKLGDFGLARIMSDPSVFRTTGGQAMGTPAYFPPELSRGASEPDALSDAYSFAVTAFLALTGELPFEGETALALIAAHWTQTPRHPGSVMVGFPEAAAESLLAGLDKTPANRPLPQTLVEQLRAVPPGDWPTVTRQAVPDDSARRRSDPTIRRPYVPSAPTKPTLPPARRRPRRKLAALIVLSIVAALAVAAGVRTLLARDPVPLRVETVSVSSDPVSGTARCPLAEFTFTASIRTNGGAGTLKLQWSRPDGQSTNARQVKVASGQRSVKVQLRFTVSGQKTLDGDAVIRVLTPQAASARHAMHYQCTS